MALWIPRKQLSDMDLLQRNHIYLAEIDHEEDFNPKYITKIEREIRPTRVIVEFNGMWKRQNITFPWYWNPPVEIAIFNAETFDLWYPVLTVSSCKKCQKPEKEVVDIV